MLQKKFRKGIVDSNIYSKIHGDKFLIVIVYIDYIIFGGDDSLGKEFSKEIQNEFEMLMFGELYFSLGLKIIQLEDVIFISHSKYAKRNLKNFGFDNYKVVTTSLTVGCKLSKYEVSSEFEQKRYKFMIAWLLYLTASRLDIM